MVAKHLWSWMSGFQVGAWWRALLDPPQALSGVELDGLPATENRGALYPSPLGLPGYRTWEELGLV